MPISSPVKVRVATVLILAFFATPLAPLVAQAPATTKPAPATAKPATTTAKPAAAAAAAPATDGGWPRAYTTASGAALVIYQPQVVELDGPETRSSRIAAVSYTPKGAQSRRSAPSSWNPTPASPSTSGS